MELIKEKWRKNGVALLLLFVLLTLPACTDKDVDERFSTPRKTYNLWLGASLNGDIPLNMSCLTKNSQKFMEQQSKNRDVFIARMTQSAAIFSNYSISEERTKGEKAIIVIKEPKSGNSIMVPLQNEDGEWKVDLIEMFSS